MTTTAVTPRARRAAVQRSAAVLAAAAGAAWLALGIESIARPGPQAYRDVLFLIPWTLTLAALVCIHLLQRRTLGRFGRIVFAVLVASMIGAIALSIPVLMGELTRHFTYIVPVWILAMAGYGVATARAGTLPRWIGVGIASSEPLTIAAGLALSPLAPLSETGSFSGAIAHGAVFLAIACGRRSLRPERNRP